MTKHTSTGALALPKVDEKLRARLAHGAALRAEMRRQIECGQEPDGYRARWLRESAQAIIRLLAERGDQFNSEHGDDALSLADFLDAIWSGRSMLLAQAAAWKDQTGATGDSE